MKRYRYITSGIALGEHKISDFRLIGGNNINAEYKALRVTIPDDLELEKLSCDSYSTTKDTRTLDELGYDVLIWSEKDRKWVAHNELKGVRPCDMHRHI